MNHFFYERKPIQAMYTNKIVCPNCNQAKILNAEKVIKYRGKTITFKCNLCQHQIIHKVTQNSLKVETTEIFLTSTHTNKNGTLKLQESSFNSREDFILNSGVQIIGRKTTNSQCDIALPTNDLSLSRAHCIITGFTKKGSNTIYFTIKDHKSKNGVIVNGLKILNQDELYLEHKDFIKLGNTLLQFEYE